MRKGIVLEELLKDGYTKKYADFYLNCLKEEDVNPNFDKEYREWAHSVGFTAESAYAYGLDEKNYNDYLSDYDFYKIWPMNDWMRVWINDKMTLKYMLHGTEFSDLMPEYYFYCTSNGLRELIDNPYKGKQDMETFIQVLKDKKAFACKPNNGTMGEGFYKLAYDQNCFFVNGKEVSKADMEKFVEDNTNFIYTEYLEPCKPFSDIDDKIHTLRMVTVNENGNDPKLLDGQFIRFSSKKEDGANLIHLDANTPMDLYNLYTKVNLKTGEFENGKKMYLASNVDTTISPVTGAEIKGVISDYDKLIDLVHGVSKYFFGVEYIGYDLCMTEKGFKLMELNSHPGIKTMQSYVSYYKNEWTEKYFKEKIAKIDSLNTEAKKRRIYIQR